MKINFINQALNEEAIDSTGKNLINLLTKEEYHTFIGISAFASPAGVNGIINHINNANQHLKKILLIVGVDQKGTSKDALEMLLQSNIDSYIFYQPSVPIFHPKIYLFESNNKTDIIIGSSNLTAQGLFQNTEASIHLNLSNYDDEDKKVIEQFKLKFKTLLDITDPNLKKITQELIDMLVAEGIVPTEIERRVLQDKEDNSQKTKTGSNLTQTFPPKKYIPIPKEFKSQNPRKEDNSTTNPVAAPHLQSKDTHEEAYLWKSGPLTERDLNIPSGPNTNVTGSMFFSKGEMEDIDQRHYFREVVFSDLKWLHDTTPNKKHLERAFANFIIKIDGVNHGPFKLKLNHDSRLDSPAYRQKNSTTYISWGETKSIIRQPKLLGKYAYLYKIENGFLLKIE